MATNNELPLWDKTLRYSIPYIIMIMLFALNLVNYSIPYMIGIKPFLILTGIFFWSIFRPSLFPPILLFFLGILTDLIINIPVGITSILLISMQLSLSDHRRFLMGAPYYIIWMLFSATCTAFAFIQWGVSSFINDNWHYIKEISVSIIISILLFPALAMLMIMVHKILPVEKSEY